MSASTKTGSFSDIRGYLQFEESFSDFSIYGGRISLSEGPSTAGFEGGDRYGYQVRRLIQTDQPICIDLSWRTRGLMVPFLAGVWKAEVFMEKMGKGEYDLPNNVAKLDYDPNATSYEISVNIPPNTVAPGTYRVVVCLTFESLADPATPGPVAAFSDLGIIKVYQESKS